MIDLTLTQQQRHDLTEIIGALPTQLENIISSLTLEQLSTPYLPNEWTVKQIVHHLADPHMNSFLRMKLTLTEDNPVWRSFDPDKLVELADYDRPAQDSLMLLASLHRRWVSLFESLQESDWQRAWLTVAGREITVESQLQTYANHSQAHLEQIKQVIAAS